MVRGRGRGRGQECPSQVAKISIDTNSVATEDSFDTIESIPISPRLSMKRNASSQSTQAKHQRYTRKNDADKESEGINITSAFRENELKEQQILFNFVL